MACSCAAVEHHARSCSRAAALDVQADNNLRAGGLRSPAHWQSKLLKSCLSPRRPLPLKSGVLQKREHKTKSPEDLRRSGRS